MNDLSIFGQIRNRRVVRGNRVMISLVVIQGYTLPLLALSTPKDPDTIATSHTTRNL